MRGALIVSTCLLVAAFALAGEPKRKQPQLEDALRRAAIRARSAEDAKLIRLSAAPNDDTMLFVAEYESGEVGIFVGGVEEKDDCFAFVDKRNVEILHEAIVRSFSRTNKKD